MFISSLRNIFILLNLSHFVFPLIIKYSNCYYESNDGLKVCSGNGRCHLVFGCQCLDGFDGPNCEYNLQIHEPTTACDFNKCHKDSICVDVTPTKYHCKCPSNRIGEFCEKEDSCFGCNGRCFETNYNIFECIEDRKRIKHQVINSSVSSKGSSSSASSFEASSTKSQIPPIEKNFLETYDSSATICPNYCLQKLFSYECNQECNIPACIFYKNICSFKADSNVQSLNIFIPIAIIFVLILFVAIVILSVKRWKRISAEIANEVAVAEEEAKRIKSIRESFYCEI